MYARATMTAPGYGMALGIRWFDILPGFRRAATDISAAGPREAYRVSRTRGVGEQQDGLLTVRNADRERASDCRTTGTESVSTGGRLPGGRG